jgi:hypothetical protein
MLCVWFRHNCTVAQLFEPLLKARLLLLYTFSEALELGIPGCVVQILIRGAGSARRCAQRGSPVADDSVAYLVDARVKEAMSECTVAVTDSVVDCINELCALSEDASFTEGETRRARNGTRTGTCW